MESEATDKAVDLSGIYVMGRRIHAEYANECHNGEDSSVIHNDGRIIKRSFMHEHPRDKVSLSTATKSPVDTKCAHLLLINKDPKIDTEISIG